MSNIHAFEFNLLGIDGNVCVYIYIYIYIEHGSSAFQADSLPSKPPGKPIYAHICMYIHTHIYMHIYNEKLYIIRIINNI